MSRSGQKQACLVFADGRGRVMDAPGVLATGRSGRRIQPMNKAELIPLPPGSELYYLPERNPVGIPARRPRDGDAFEVLDDCQAVAAFLPSGYAVLRLASFERLPQAPLLPLHAYAAVCWYRGEFHVPAVRVEQDTKHDPAEFSDRQLGRHVARLRRRLPKNPLVEHLAENCALRYGCANAKNLFYGRWECPIPIAPACNAACVGCISAQPDAPIASPQDRLAFVPSIADVLEVAVPHLETASRAMISFGQGCEGEPLLQGDLMCEIIREIRRRTERGTIHLNTNGSRPDMVAKLCDSGLDSIRVSLNSTRHETYARYYRPRNYSFEHVLDTIREARSRGRFTSINYLSFPGLTDSPAEIDSLVGLLESPGLDMIQWRNLNMDPDAYCDTVALPMDEPAIGMASLLTQFRAEFPSVRHGYVNPPRESWNQRADEQRTHEAQVLPEPAN